MIKRIGGAAAAVAVLLASASAAVAQTPSQPAPSPAPAQMGVPPASGIGSARVERQLAMLHHRLVITAAQSLQWDAFALIMRENARRMDQVVAQRQQAAATRNAVDDLGAYASIERAHADDLQRLIGPFADLYATMSDTQKRIADAMFRRIEENAPRGGAAHG